MTSILPITLLGDNLGKRHKQINNLVNEVYHDVNQNFEIIKNTAEKSAVDRLFKIDLAFKHRDVDYIVKNLKDSDMLYVSRALKSVWLLEPTYQDIINPENLEDNIYPFMVTTAVNKMKHWLHLNLKNEQRSEDFYKFYYEKDFELAIHFLVKSSKDFIINEFQKVVHKVTPKYFKLLCEKNSQVAKIFFDFVTCDKTIKSQYLNNEKNIYESLKGLLKSDTNFYLDITEKYFNVNQFSRFSSIATKFIMSYHKDRFTKKPELYTAWILDIATLAEYLNSEEVKDLVSKLAGAKYLQWWFEYKKVEPLIKRLKPEERAAFKKKVFVEKDIGDYVEDWPYQPPSAPEIEHLGSDIFEDSQHHPQEYARMSGLRSLKRCIRKRCMKSQMMCDIISCDRVKTMLDKLFDEYRFVSFEKTLYELRKRISAESTPQNRQFIMLVLISKTGGRPDAIATLMELLARHSNEPPNLRATIIRSLVKRASIWRLPEETWKQLLLFGQGLGLDGNTSETNCIEGLHSVVIRSLINTGTCDTVIFDAFLSNFSDLSAYSLASAEKKCVIEALPKMLLSTAKSNNKVEDAVDVIIKLIEVLKIYKVKADTYLDLIPTVAAIAQKDFSACSYLIENLFNAKIGRKALFRFTYKLIKTDASHMNALKHDINVLDFEIFNEHGMNFSKFDNFFRKTSVYFNEEGGLAMKYRIKLKEIQQNNLIARPLVILLGSELQLYLQELDKKTNVESKVFAATIRANAHMTRPSLDIDTFGWRKAGAKLIANKLLICPSIDIQKNIQNLLKWKRTARLALVLSSRTQKDSLTSDVFVSVAKLRPTIGIKIGIKLMKQQGDSFNTKIWETIKQLIKAIDFTKNMKQFYVLKVIDSVDCMSMKIKPEFNIILFDALDKVDSKPYASMPSLCRIEHVLLNVQEDFIENILFQFLEKYFTIDKIDDNSDNMLRNRLYLRILFTYIYLSKSEEIAKQRFETFGAKALNCMTEIYQLPESNEIFFEYLDEIMLNFKNTKVFLNPEYVACLFVMENTVSWMRTILPLEKYFDRYAKIHLTMLYYKAIRQTVKQAPEVFENEIIKYKEAVKIVGNLFGQYISKEVRELMGKYFESILFLYKDAIVSYLDNYFNYSMSSNFISTMIKGILEEGKDEVRLGLYVLEDKYYDLSEEVSAEIRSGLNEVRDLKSKFFVFA